MNEIENLRAQIDECEIRIQNKLDSILPLLTTAIRLNRYIKKCRERLVELGEQNG